MGQRTIRSDPVHLEHDRARLFVADQNLQHAPAREILELHVVLAAVVVEADVGDFDPDLAGHPVAAAAVPRACGNQRHNRGERGHGQGHCVAMPHGDPA